MSKNNRKARQKSATLRFKQTGKNMTGMTGLIPVIKFLDKLGFGALFQKKAPHDRSHNAVYNLEDGFFWC